MQLLLKFIVRVLFIVIDYYDLYSSSFINFWAHMPRKKIIYVYFTILANFMILVVLEIISYGVGMGRTTLCCCYFL